MGIYWIDETLFSSLAGPTNRTRPCKKRSWPHKRAAPPCRTREATVECVCRTMGVPLVASKCASALCVPVTCIAISFYQAADRLLILPLVYIIPGNLYLAAIPDSLSRECCRARFTLIDMQDSWKTSMETNDLRLAILNIVSMYCGSVHQRTGTLPSWQITQIGCTWLRYYRVRSI